MQKFDFGCNDKFLGRTYWKSATGHSITMSDVEDLPKLRGKDNYIRIQSAVGNRIELNDHTVGEAGGPGEKDCPECPPNVAGEERGILLQSTSNHIIRLSDNTNEQCGACRKEGGVPTPKAKEAYILIRSGYGLQMEFRDENSQEGTQKQYVQIFCPQKDNKERGPHIHRYQEKPSGPGQVFLRAGGDYIVSTYDFLVEIVGDEEKNPSDKLTVVSRNKIVSTKQFYVNLAEIHLFLAKRFIFLLAGRTKDDCRDPDSNPPCDLTPCPAPVIVFFGGCARISDRVFASCSRKAERLSIFHLFPLAPCPLPVPCPGECPCDD